MFFAVRECYRPRHIGLLYILTAILLFDHVLIMPCLMINFLTKLALLVHCCRLSCNNLPSLLVAVQVTLGASHINSNRSSNSTALHNSSSLTFNSKLTRLTLYNNNSSSSNSSSNSNITPSRSSNNSSNKSWQHKLLL